ncbi:hypothetical protein SUGI_0468300 [Cryptomeria japonica]|nr:hypothetical protein SUGI_0468300 [Cryptomeria japonica]
MAHALRLPRFLFLVTISLYCLVSCCNGSCGMFRCGNYTWDYPFGAKDSGCGDPTLLLECDEEAEMPLITIGAYQYYILNPTKYIHLVLYKEPTMKILYKHLKQDECDLSESIYDQFWSANQFPITDGYSNITLGTTCTVENAGPNAGALTNLTCNDYRYYNVSKVCASEFRIPVKEIDLKLGKPLSEITGAGINITWYPSRICEHCETDYRNCTYRRTSSFCYCHASSYSQCSTGKTGSSRTVVILDAAIVSVLLFLAALLLVVLYRKRLPISKELTLHVDMEPSLTKVEQFLDDFAHEMPIRYSFSQLKKITNNFADKLGEGGFGVVFKGKLPKGDLVAVKILDQSRHSETQFMNEVATMGRIHHLHLVRLMGYCFEGFRSVLVYEYMLEMMLRGSGKAEIESEEKEKAIKLAKVGLWCIQYNLTDRPSMSRVVQMLEGNDDVSNPPLPFNSSPDSQLNLQFSTEEFSSLVCN